MVLSLITKPCNILSWQVLFEEIGLVHQVQAKHRRTLEIAEGEAVQVFFMPFSFELCKLFFFHHSCTCNFYPFLVKG